MGEDLVVSCTKWYNSLRKPNGREIPPFSAAHDCRRLYRCGLLETEGDTRRGASFLGEFPIVEGLQTQEIQAGHNLQGCDGSWLKLAIVLRVMQAAIIVLLDDMRNVLEITLVAVMTAILAEVHAASLEAAQLRSRVLILTSNRGACVIRPAGRSLAYELMHLVTLFALVVSVHSQSGHH